MSEDGNVASIETVQPICEWAAGETEMRDEALQIAFAWVSKLTNLYQMVYREKLAAILNISIKDFAERLHNAKSDPVPDRFLEAATCFALRKTAASDGSSYRSHSALHSDPSCDRLGPGPES